MLLINHKPANNENDLELKKLIACQFENELNMKTWAMDFFEQVSDPEKGKYKLIVWF